MLDQDQSDDLRERVTNAFDTRTALRITGGNSKRFYGRSRTGEELNLCEHSGIVDYQPTELVITARAGTPVIELQQALAEHNQFIPFEPPCYTDTATLGGAIATGLSGPGRPTWGAARDLVLGVTCLNGRGEQLSFGGQVMKNVAGYDVSRLMVGAMGTLGVLLDISMKVLPCPRTEQTQILEMNEIAALACMTELNQRALPVSATAFIDDKLYVRLSGSEAAVSKTANHIGGESLRHQDPFWSDLRDHRLPYFQSGDSLWRVSIAPASGPIQGIEQPIIEWNGGVRWLYTGQTEERIRALAASHGGHATLFRNGDPDSIVFQPLENGLAELHRNLRNAFDPHGILNPGIMYSDANQP